MHEHFIKLLVENRFAFEQRLSQKSLGAIFDFVSGYSRALGITEWPGVLSAFRTWLGVELCILRPSSRSGLGGYWIGPELNWQMMLQRHYGSPDAAYEGFFLQYREYVRRSRHSAKRLDVSKQSTDSFFFKDFGDGYPIAVDALQIEGHPGVYTFRIFQNQTSRIAAYFSSIEDALHCEQVWT